MDEPRKPAGPARFRSSAARRPFELATNLLLAASTALHHVQDDPARAAVLAGRLIPRPLERRALRLMSRVPASRMPSVAAYARARSGDRAGAAAVVEQSGGASARVRARLAALYLALDRPEEAERVGDVPAVAARLAERSGALTEAAEVATGRTARRLRGALTLLDPAQIPAGAAEQLNPVRDRVLHLVTNSLPYKRAGYNTRTAHIVRAQRDAGLDPYVATRIGFPVVQGSPTAPHRETVDGVAYQRLLPAWRPWPDDAAERRNVAMAAKVVRELRPAVLHAATDFRNGRVALALGRRFGLPVVYEVRGFLEDSWASRRDDPEAALASERYRLERAMETAVMQVADVVVTLGEGMREEIASRGVDVDKIVLTPNAVDDAFLAPPPDATALRARLGIAPDEPVLGFVGTMFQHEGLLDLVEAWALLRRELPVRLLLVGDGADRPAVQRRLDDLGLADAAIVTGHVPAAEVRDYYGALDVFAIPRIDARVTRLVTPLKPLEAMASGRPVVASDLPALAEIVTPSGGGVLAPASDPAAFAAASLPLLRDSALRDALGGQGREWVIRNRTWAATAQTYAAIYRKLGAF